MARKTNLEIQAAYLENLAHSGRRVQSAKQAGTSRTTIMRWQQEYPDFDTACEEALEQYRESLQAEIYRRGVEGVDEPVFYQGVHVGDVRKYSDALLILEAKRHMPEYRDRSTTDVNVKGGVLVVREPATTPEEWEKRFS